jgi:hypothetical protein
MFGGAPPGLQITEDPAATVRFTATDSGRQWLVTLGRVGGEYRGRQVDEPTFVVADEDDGRPVAASITGLAEDLDCWLWNRPQRHSVEHQGDHDVIARTVAVVREGIT